MTMNIRTTFLQVWHSLRTSPSDSILHILGIAFVTAFASVLMVRTVNRYMPVYPEDSRNRILVCDRLSAKCGAGTVQAGVGEAFNAKFVDGIPQVECSDITFRDYDAVRFTADGRSERLVNMYVGENFWKIHSFRFLDGGPIPSERYDPVNPGAVISASAARALFGTENAAGKTIAAGGRELAVCGVVQDVPAMSVMTFAHVWMPCDMIEEEAGSGLAGDFCSVILCRERSMRRQVAGELERRIEAYNLTSGAKEELSLDGGPGTVSRYSDHIIYGEPSGVGGRQLLILLLLVLLVSVNITGLVFFRMKLREEELGIRRSFGAGRRDVFLRIVGENLVLSLAGGVAGVIAGSALLLSMSRSFSGSFIEKTYMIFGTTVPAPYADVSVVFRPVVLAVVLLCVVLAGVASSLLPALSVSRKSIVNLIDKEE